MPAFVQVTAAVQHHVAPTRVDAVAGTQVDAGDTGEEICLHERIQHAAVALEDVTIRMDEDEEAHAPRTTFLRHAGDQAEGQFLRLPRALQDLELGLPPASRPRRLASGAGARDLADASVEGAPPPEESGEAQGARQLLLGIVAVERAPFVAKVRLGLGLIVEVGRAPVVDVVVLQAEVEDNDVGPAGETLVLQADQLLRAPVALDAEVPDLVFRPERLDQVRERLAVRDTETERDRVPQHHDSRPP